MQPLAWHIKPRREPTESEREAIEAVVDAAREYAAAPEGEQRRFVRSVLGSYVSGHDIALATRFRFDTADWPVLRAFVEACSEPDPFHDEPGTMPVRDTAGTLWPREVLHEHQGKIVRRGEQSWLLWPVLVGDQIGYPQVPDGVTE